MAIKTYKPYTPARRGKTDQIRRKPAPDMVHAALKKLGADASDACYIGDSDVDIMTARGSRASA